MHVYLSLWQRISARMNNSINFYDEFSGRLLADYVYGNRRVEAAIIHALNWIPHSAKRILDVGCGIGWSTWEIKRHHPQAFVLGMDISDKMVRIAKTLFDAPNLAFSAHDITQWSVLLSPPYNAIVMLDVYEHIPKELRKVVHDILSRSLLPGGVIILTFPSSSHQQFLRKYQPSGLQPVDEDVKEEDIIKLASHIDGHIVYYKYVSIWRPNDYVHTVIQQKSQLAHNINNKKENRPQNPNLEPKRLRSDRVNSRLKARVTPEGVIIPDREGPVVCIISPNRGAYSETFIRAHIERLPAKIRVIYGWWRTEDDRPLLPPHIFHRAMRYALRKFLHLPPEFFQTNAIKRFFKANGVDAVLAEYGPTGVAVMDACVKAGVPLIVHFHGFDAYDCKTIEKYISAYRQMFNVSSSIIAVSRDMEKELLKLGAPREKLFYNPCGVDTSLFSGADPAKAPPLFVAVGRFVDKKAPHLTLLAFKRLLEQVPDARMIMIGDGELWEACKQLAQALRINHAIEFPGPRPHTYISATMRTARAFVQHSMRTSYGDSEGTPVAVLEAGATGLPVISTRHGGIKDVVIDGETGFLVDEGDVESMAEKMLLLARDPDLAGQLGKKARERICTEFSMEKSIANLWRIIETAIRKRCRP